MNLCVRREPGVAAAGKVVPFGLAVTTRRVTLETRSREMMTCFRGLDNRLRIGACEYVQRAGREPGPFRTGDRRLKTEDRALLEPYDPPAFLGVEV
jgi:hypothetical protein